MLPLKNILRSLHTTLPQLLRHGANPGISLQLQELEHKEDLAEDPEGFGNVESDLMEVHTTHKQYESEMIAQQDRVRRIMIKHKYFRGETLPNLVTYAEKEQMRLLHARDPEEWTPERLAESFPATPDIIEKILRAKWKPRSVQRIRKHDEAVISNWEKLRSDKASNQFPPSLLEHLQKFGTRRKEDLQIPVAEELQIQPKLPVPQRKEFLSLITSCIKYAENSSNKKRTDLLKPGKGTHLKGKPQLSNMTAAEKDEETYLLEKVKDKRKMRLQELKELKLTPAELATSPHNIRKDNLANGHTLEQRAVEAFGNPAGTGVVTELLPNFIEKFQSNEVVISAEDQRRFEINKVKEQIYIPRKLWRKGATYRVEECYYDDDGELLYRVPGMTGKLN